MKFRLSLICATLVLTACGNQAALPTKDQSLQERLRNPLYAESYYDVLTEQMVNFALDTTFVEETGSQSTIDRTRTRSLEHSGLAVEAQQKGKSGKFISDRGLTFGEALLLEDVLYFGTDFETSPGPALQVYLSNVIDPRDVEFPDDSSVALGPLKDVFGAQSLSVPERPATHTGSLRTVVLWDADLEFIYGFVQLRQQQ